MKLGNYESYQAVTTNDLVQLNDLLVRAYVDNAIAKSASKKHRSDFVSKVRFDSLDTSKEHILTRKIGDSSPCGAITIYKDTKHSLPIELCLNITLNPIRTKNIKICEAGRLVTLSKHRTNSDNLLLLFIAAIQHCFKNQILLMTIQAFSFNHERYNSLGFNYFNGCRKGCYDLEFDTTCYPMYASIHDIYNNFKKNIFNDRTINLIADKPDLVLQEDIQKIDVRIDLEQSNVKHISA